jgi:hypothetical protein
MNLSIRNLPAAPSVCILILAAFASASAQEAGRTGQASDKPSDQKSIYISFDAPGAGTAAHEGTFPSAVNLEGDITGYYFDVNDIGHAFLREADGSFFTFDVPGNVNGTYATAINQRGEVTGYYYDEFYISHGFLRSHSGSITTFDAPGAAEGIVPLGINAEGAITGNSADANLVFHGLLRDPRGNITTFDVPGAGSGLFEGTFVYGVLYGGNYGGINGGGKITGAYADSSFTQHGFLRAPDGSLTTFDVSNGSQTGPTAISDTGEITGTYFESIVGNPFGGNYRAFVRDRDGKFSTFDAATYSPCCIWTFAEAINSGGQVTGYDNDGHNLFHGFVRGRDGTVTTFDAPGAGTESLQGTLAVGINQEGTIAGSYIDAAYVNHGFLRKKQAIE